MLNLNSVGIDTTQVLRMPRSGNGFANIALMLPTLFGVVWCFANYVSRSFGMSVVAVMATAALVVGAAIEVNGKYSWRNISRYNEVRHWHGLFK